ncbi:hypothetical protein [Blastococcus sp. PRF04-17]|uniref:hypothetical protein n=1 Tax=Blastococcus sp. PRF04-17 TaxID=2933797 RepID=UPI001FF502E3|nr:hypothetical protein [Blastococcus sp. PRF04-17]UOY03671.1 hypothetical protein MVA48_10205 [Blastococcus sp. PRF04-17]
MTTGVRPGWGLVLAVSVPAVAWPTVLGTIGAALAVTGTLALLPAAADPVLPVLAVLVLACAAAVAADDDTSPVTTSAPVPVRRRLAARVGLVLPASAVGLGAVLAVAGLAGAQPDRGLALLWAVLTVVALAVGVAAHRAWPDLPGMAAAAVALVVGLVVALRLPAAVLTVAAWDSTPERVGIAVVLSALVLAVATRDPAA